jgi:glycosyltransferase involved in cell wall biosynthesis
METNNWLITSWNMHRSFTKHDDADGDGQQRGTVLIVTPGGLEHGGGIGRQMGYFLQACQTTAQKLHYRVVDSRGPWYIGASPLHIAGAIIYFCRAALIMFVAHLSSPCVAHVNITGRGSTIRKVILLTIARAVGLRYVLHLHDYDYIAYYRGRGTLLRSLIATMFRRAATVVVLGGRDLEVVSQSLQLPRDRMIVLYNAVPDPLPDLSRTSRSGKQCHLHFLGYLSSRKGVPELLRALASPTMKSRRWRATLAGGGPIDEFRKLADDLGILDRLCFPGWLDQVGVRTVCGDADVLVLPSHAEGLAMSVLEGLSHGLAVVTTPVGAHLEVIERDVSGILVPPGDVAALADALISVIEDETLRRRLARGARQRFLEGFDVRGYAARLGQLHASLLTTPHNQSETVGKEQIS